MRHTSEPQVFNFKRKSEDEPQPPAGLSYVRQESGCSQEGEAYSQREPGPVCSATCQKSYGIPLQLEQAVAANLASVQSETVCKRHNHVSGCHNAWGVPATACGRTCSTCTGPPESTPSSLTWWNQGLQASSSLPAEFWDVARRVEPFWPDYVSEPSAHCLQSSGGPQTRSSGPWQQSSARTAATTRCCRSALGRR